MAPSEVRRYLALLPPPPQPSSYESIKAAYNASLLTVLRDISHSGDQAQPRTVLEVALPCPHLHGQEEVPRSVLYAPTQRLLAGLYKLICVICAKHSINVEDSDGIDVRVLLVAYPRDGKPGTVTPGSPETDAEGPIISLQALAKCGRQWNTVFAVETEAGEQMLKYFTALLSTSPRISKVRGGIVQAAAKGDVADAEAPTTQSRRKHLSVAVGGTFDHLHIGHKLLLSMTAFMLDAEIDPFSSSTHRSLTIGITGDELLKNKKHADHLESWKSRQQMADEFLRSVIDFSAHGQQLIKTEEINDPGPNGHAVHVTLPSKLTIKYVEIWDPFGPTITDKEISALVISAETRSGGAAVNTKRGEKQWPPLEVFEVDVLDPEEELTPDNAQQAKTQETFQSKLSSTEIRRKLSEKVSGRNKM